VTGDWRRTGWRHRTLLASIVSGAILASTPAPAQETPSDIIAAHVRTQGYTCDKALDAQRDASASQPNEAVWMLRCSNATYRVRLVPDMAAQVELMESGSSN
jgi:hypothetical protein